MKFSPWRRSFIWSPDAVAAAAFFLFLAQEPVSVLGDLVLNEHILALAISTAELAIALRQQESSPDPSGEGFDVLQYESGKAILARKNGYCFVTYRGSSPTWTHWDAQDFGREKICTGNSTTTSSQKPSAGAGTCCSTRIGFARAYNATPRDRLEKAIRECVNDCTNPDECLIFGGHGEGGAMAAIAALEMIDLPSYVMTFGQPNTIDTPCPILCGERYFRFVNTNISTEYGITYDPVPFIQGLGAGDNFGYMIFLSDDSTRVASIALAGGRAEDFRPKEVVPFELQTHSRHSHDIPEYLDRLRNLFNSVAGGSIPVRTNGFADGSVCNDSLECRSGQCFLDDQNPHKNSNWTVCVPRQCKVDDDGQCFRSDVCAANGVCVPKRQSCVACEKHSDCSSGRCLSGLCTGASGLLDNNCICNTDTECASHRCRSGMCEARRSTGAICVSSADCSSGLCAAAAPGITIMMSSADELRRCQDPPERHHQVVPTVVGDFDVDGNPPFSGTGSWPTRIAGCWGSRWLVVLCCMILTFTIVKRCLQLRGRKGYASIPIVEVHY